MLDLFASILPRLLGSFSVILFRLGVSNFAAPFLLGLYRRQSRCALCGTIRCHYASCSSKESLLKGALEQLAAGKNEDKAISFSCCAWILRLKMVSNLFFVDIVTPNNLPKVITLLNRDNTRQAILLNSRKAMLHRSSRINLQYVTTTQSRMTTENKGLIDSAAANAVPRTASSEEGPWMSWCLVSSTRFPPLI